MSVPIACQGRGLCVLFAVALIAAPAPRQAGASGVTWEEKIEVASGGAYRGPWRMNESEFHYVDDPTVAINEQGFVRRSKVTAWSNGDISRRSSEDKGGRTKRAPREAGVRTAPTPATASYGVPSSVFAQARASWPFRIAVAHI